MLYTAAQTQGEKLYAPDHTNHPCSLASTVSVHAITLAVLYLSIPFLCFDSLKKKNNDHVPYFVLGLRGYQIFT